jgi:hypothetical protein
LLQSLDHHHEAVFVELRTSASPFSARPPGSSVRRSSPRANPGPADAGHRSSGADRFALLGSSNDVQEEPNEQQL